MAIVLHHAEKAELGAFTPKPTSTTEGQQEAMRTVWTAPEGVEAGVWEATPGRFTAAREGYHEVCQILSGRATLTPTGGEPVEISPGDTLVTPAGWTGVWEVHETLRKTYITISLPALLGDALDVTEQAAQQRPTPRESLSAVLDAAQALAQSSGHNETDSGHLLVALADTSTAVQGALASFGVTPAAVRTAVEERWAVKSWRRHPVPPGDFPYFGLDSSMDLRRVEEAFDGPESSPGQLFLAILECRSHIPGPGREALHNLGLTTRQAQEALARNLSG